MTLWLNCYDAMDGGRRQTPPNGRASASSPWTHGKYHIFTSFYFQTSSVISLIINYFILDISADLWHSTPVRKVRHPSLSAFIRVGGVVF